MKKILTLTFGLLLTVNTAFAGLRQELSNVISQSKINSSSISVSVKNAKTGKTAYELNAKMPVSPASTQKIITATPAFMVLGEDYKFSTKLYKNNSNDYVVVLGADPYLTSRDLEKLVKFIPKEPHSINIDSTIIDDNEWGEGWQWDDDLNPLMPKFSAYNIDRNLMEITISPTVKNFPARITQEISYPITFINHIVTGKSTAYTLKRQNHISPDVIIAEGSIQYNQSSIREIPINNPKKYFIMRLSDAIINQNISSSGEYAQVKINNKYNLITLLSHDISQAKKDIYKNSNNLTAETVFKLAGGKYKGATGSFENGLEMFKNFCETHHLDTTKINIVDASGVSKNNLMTSDFMTDFLICTQGFLENELPTPGEGTLSNRMLYLKNNVHAKTGTLSNISALTGYITTRKNQKYVFSIMINNSEFTSGEKKMLEEYILRTIYNKG